MLTKKEKQAIRDMDQKFNIKLGKYLIRKNYEQYDLFFTHDWAYCLKDNISYEHLCKLLNLLLPANRD